MSEPIDSIGTEADMAEQANHNGLETLPDGLYALIWFARWESLRDMGDGASLPESDALYLLELHEAIHDGSAVIIPNLRPPQLPSAYEAMAQLSEAGASLVGHNLDDERALQAFDQCYSIHCSTMDALIAVQREGESHAIH